jgi:hypothetical protein
LELISTDLISRTMSISHTLIGGGGVLMFLDSGPPLLVPISSTRTDVCRVLMNTRICPIPAVLQQWKDYTTSTSTVATT